jgi:hypothetical protein
MGLIRVQFASLSTNAIHSGVLSKTIGKIVSKAVWGYSQVLKLLRHNPVY